MGKLFRKIDFSNGVKYWYIGDWKFAKKVGKCFYLLGKKKCEDNYTGREWYVGWPDWKFEITYQECGYEEGNGELHISLLGWHSVFKMPWKSKRFPDGDCDAPIWGIMIHDSTLWLHYGGNGNMNGGGKFKSWDLPFFTMECVRHQVECDLGDGKYTLVDYDKLQKLNDKYIPLKDNELVHKYHYNYVDNYDGSIVPCTYWIEEREWRRKWFKWCDWFKIVNRYIEIEFDGEVGRDKGSWKGGCTGCSYTLLPNETPEECIRRMEKERKF